MARPQNPPPGHLADRIVGQSPAIRLLRTQIRQLAPFDTPGNDLVPTLLLHGETGTGKGLIARVIHESGPRARGSFIEINCAALPEPLLEGELFGFAAGAFTDAKRAKPGLFEVAAGGTLFLDEIDALPLALQGKLLTAIEAKRVRRLGEVKERSIDVKLIAATQAELGARVREGRFRADLYHRLAVIVLALPPLRQRREDVVLLAQHFLQRYAAAYGMEHRRLSSTAEAWLRRQLWPGNVRELGHLLERAMLLRSERVITPKILEELGLERSAAAAGGEREPAPGLAVPADEAARIRQALHHTGGNVLQAARVLGLTRKAMRYRMRRYGIERPRPHAVSPPQVARGDAEAIAPAGPWSRKGVAASDARGHTPPSEPHAAAPEWEQKGAAVLAVEVTWPEVAAEVIRVDDPWAVAAHWEAVLVETLEKFGGVVLQRSPALLTAAFGAPRALEQVPQRAVQAALALRHLIAEAQAPPEQASVPTVRQAVHWGQLLVETRASDAAARLLAVGETLACPVRLLAQAAPGEILLSPTVARLVEGWCELERHSGPLAASRVVRLTWPQPPLAQHRRPLSRFVGREQELAVLAERLAQVEAGRGQIVRIMAEPGLGKSRLLYECRQRLIGPGLRYLEGHCLSYGQATPYLPVRDLLREACGISGVDGREVVIAKVRLSLYAGGMDVDAAAPYLLSVLGAPAGSEHLIGPTSEVTGRQVFEVLHQLCFRMARHQPLVIAVENLQWIDQTSEAFLASLAERLAGARILLLATYRPGYRPPWLEQSSAIHIMLPPLSPQDSLRMLHTLVPMAQLPAALTQAILAKAEGNPFFLEEIAHALIEQGLLGRAFTSGPEGGVDASGSSLARMHIPATVQEVVATRLDRLAPQAKGLLQMLAVIGTPCPLRLLAQVSGRSEGELRDQLASPEAAAFIDEWAVASAPVYAIKHALTQGVVYASLPAARRRMLHERTAQALETLCADQLEAHYGELAHHYSHSGNAAQAVAYLQRAGQQAVERSAHAEAISLLTRGLERLRALPDTPERARQELMLQLTLGVPLTVTRGHADPEAQRAYARARQLCGQAGETPQLVRALRGLWRYHLVRGELQTARELAAQLHTLTRRAPDLLGITLCHLGAPVTARTHIEQAITLYVSPKARGPIWHAVQEPGVACLAYASWPLWLLGYPDQALKRSHEAIARAQELAHPFSLAFARHFAARMHQLRREVRAAHEQAAATIALSREQGFAFFLAVGTIVRGWALAGQGRTAEGIAQIQQGLAAHRATGAGLDRAHHLALLAEAYGRAGQAGMGLKVLAEALAEARDHGERYYEAELYRIQGQLMMARAVECDGEAEACFQQALQVARRQRAKSLELRAAISLSRLWRQQGRREEARQLLAPIYGWFTEGFDTADLQEARTLLEELS